MAVQIEKLSKKLTRKALEKIAKLAHDCLEGKQEKID